MLRLCTSVSALDMYFFRRGDVGHLTLGATLCKTAQAPLYPLSSPLIFGCVLLLQFVFKNNLHSQKVQTHDNSVQSTESHLIQTARSSYLIQIARSTREPSIKGLNHDSLTTKSDHKKQKKTKTARDSNMEQQKEMSNTTCTSYKEG